MWLLQRGEECGIGNDLDSGRGVDNGLDREPVVVVVDDDVDKKPAHDVPQTQTRTNSHQNTTAALAN